jgi:hypothetical protein
MAIQTYKKKPNAKLDYGFDWSEWLETGDTLATAVWTVPTGLVNEAEDLNDTIAAVWLSGGTAGESYEVVCLVTTTEGRIDERSFVIVCEA